MPTNLNLFIIKVFFANMKKTGSTGYYYPKYACMYVSTASGACTLWNDTAELYFALKY